MGIASPNEWTQREERVLMPVNNYNTTTSSILTTTTATTTTTTATATTKVMERSGQDNLQAFKCPRCESSNTKFCYYNNYSLSQPRHFCKACKRYWTRGGTLRNMPVGGGCRKNKRVNKKPVAASDPLLTTAISPPISSLPSLPSLISVSTAASSDLGSLFYNLSNPCSDMNLTLYPSLRSRLQEQSIHMPCTTYHIQPHQLNSVGLSLPSNPQLAGEEDYQSGCFKNHLTNYHIQQTASPSNLQEYSLFGSPLYSSAAGSFFASSFKQPYDDFHAVSSSGNLELFKVEETVNVTNHNRLEWQVPCENALETIAADSPLNWNNNSTPVNAWHDVTNCGSSVTPLI